jgi:hypothetical protein
MKKQVNFSLKTVITASMFAALIMGCEKDETPNTDTPANKIADSEILSIPAEIELPGNLPGGNSRVATYYAEGVQRYKAQLKEGSIPAAYEWVFVAPKADLYDASNKRIGIHGAGPYWALSAADSIFAQQFSPVRSASPDANSIPWLLLMPKEGKIPTGVFANVNYIQRIATTGGKAPATAPLSSTDTIDVFYTAVYRFVKKN